MGGVVEESVGGADCAWAVDEIICASDSMRRSLLRFRPTTNIPERQRLNYQDRRLIMFLLFAARSVDSRFILKLNNLSTDLKQCIVSFF
jgi:hypothetical protein